jgi:micrococcal nuclease
VQVFNPKTTKQSKKGKKALSGVILSILLALSYYFTNPKAPSQLQSVNTPTSAMVIQAVDGDTLNVLIDGRKDIVRLIGVDTPETHDPRKAVQCFGLAAATYTKNLAESKKVRLEADPQDSNRDKYRRLLRYVYLPNGTLLNAELIKNGYGFAYTVFPYTKIELFRQYERDARAASRGLWGGCEVDTSSQIKQTQEQH